MIDLAVHLLGVTPENKRKERQLNHNCILLVHATCGEKARSVTDKLQPCSLEDKTNATNI